MEARTGPEPLPLLAEASFSREPELYEVVSFLNRVLKARGLVFGYSERGGVFTISVYETPPWQEAPEG